VTRKLGAGTPAGVPVTSSVDVSLGSWAHRPFTVAIGDGRLGRIEASAVLQIVAQIAGFVRGVAGAILRSVCRYPRLWNKFMELLPVVRFSERLARRSVCGLPCPRISADLAEWAPRMTRATGDGRVIGSCRSTFLRSSARAGSYWSRAVHRPALQARQRTEAALPQELAQTPGVIPALAQRQERRRAGEVRA